MTPAERICAEVRLRCVQPLSDAVLAYRVRAVCDELLTTRTSFNYQWHDEIVQRTVQHFHAAQER